MPGPLRYFLKYNNSMVSRPLSNRSVFIRERRSGVFGAALRIPGNTAAGYR